MCTALREAGIQTSEWVKHLRVKIQLQISPSEFFEGWCTYAEVSHPSWVNLAEAMQKISNYKQAAEKVRMIEGIMIVKIEALLHFKMLIEAAE